MGATDHKPQYATVMDLAKTDKSHAADIVTDTAVRMGWVDADGYFGDLTFHDVMNRVFGRKLESHEMARLTTVLRIAGRVTQPAREAITRLNLNI